MNEVNLFDLQGACLHTPSDLNIDYYSILMAINGRYGYSCNRKLYITLSLFVSFRIGPLAIYKCQLINARPTESPTSFI